MEHGGRRRKPKQEAKDRKPAEMREEVIIVKEEFPQQKSATAKVEDTGGFLCKQPFPSPIIYSKQSCC